VIDPVIWEDLGIAAALIGITVVIMVWAFYRLRRRHSELAKELAESKASIEDRAFNEIHIARSAANHLARTGKDVGAIRRLVDQASEAYQSRDYPNALALGTSAREALLHVREGTTPAPAVIPAASSPPTSDPLPSSSRPAIVPAVPTMAPEGGDDLPQPPTARLPRNKAESHFQLTLLDTDLLEAGRAGRTDPSVAEAQGTAADARRAYDRADYTEALRLGLKGRRRIGARLETLPPPTAAVPEPPADGAPGAEVAPPSNCSTCGQPMRASDRFCRGCGTSRSVSRCPQCGEALTGSDRFCGVCGAPIRT
jgi:hypothetical protein